MDVIPARPRIASIGVMAVTIALLTAGFATAAAPGSLDPSFGSGGTATMDFGGMPDVVRSITVQPDHKILAVGSSFDGGSPSGCGETCVFELARFLPDGRPDPGFGSRGGVVSDFGTGEQQARDVALRPDGSFVVAGWRGENDFSRLLFEVAKYRFDGSLDPTFGSDGYVTTPFLGFDFANAIGSYPAASGLTDRVVVAGEACATEACGPGLPALARYLDDGRLDPSFGSDGRVMVPWTDLGDQENSDILSVSSRRDGSLDVAGFAWNGHDTDLVIARYLWNGQLDPDFGRGGVTRLDLGGDEYGIRLARTKGGGIVVGGAACSPRDGLCRFLVARFDPNGHRTRSFGSGGWVTTVIGDTTFGRSLVLQPDGKIVLVGEAYVDDHDVFGVARYTPQGKLDPTFGSAGTLTVSFSAGENRPYAVDVARDGDIVVGGYTGDPGDFAIAKLVGGPFRLRVAVHGGGTVVSTPAGIRCPERCSGVYSVGKRVRLTANPAPGWRFAQWRGACGGTHRCVVRMDAARSVTAVFVTRS